MSTHLTRRTFLTGAAVSAAAVATAGRNWPSMSAAHAKETLVATEWGPPYIDASKAIAAKFDKADIQWELYTGGAATILAKIKATWPNTPYDLVDNWNPVFRSLINEGWAETVTVSDVPNLKDVPEGLIFKDEKGNWKSIPRDLTGAFFAYRRDICPVEIRKVDDLLDPRLKGKIAWPASVLWTSMQVAALALPKGGNEYNMDPGWEFLKELARMGNIGRVVSTSSDLINTLTTGETCVTFIDQGTLSTMAKEFPIQHLTKTDESLKVFLYTEGWTVLASSKKKPLAFEFANFSISPENCELFAKATGNVPANSKSKTDPSVKHLTFTDEEVKKYVHFVDYDDLSKQADARVKRFETEIAPLLR